MIKSICFGSRNAGKIKEVKRILGSFGINVFSYRDNIKDPIESGNTFKDNAIIKASEIARQMKCFVVADDSGLVVPALSKKYPFPGHLSARLSLFEKIVDGELINFNPNLVPKNKIIETNNNKLIELMKSERNKTAYYVCSLALADMYGNITFLCEENTTNCIILESPRGNKGFGYDPIVLDTNLNLTFAEMTDEQKDEKSHRGKAFRRLVEYIRT